MAMAEVRDIRLGATIGAVRSPSVSALAWAAASLIYVLITYPYQMVVFPLFGSTPPLVYGILCLVGIAVLLGFRSPPRRVELAFPTFLALGMLACTMLVTLAVTRNPTVIRDLLLLTLVAIVVFRSRGDANIQIMRALVYISVVTYLPTFVIVAMVNFGLIDLPTWSVERIGLEAVNPALLRQTWADADYYMPFWLALIPHSFDPHDVADQGFGLHFTRQPLVFIEPTDTWYYTVGLFWFAVVDRKLFARRICLIVMALALAVSFSVAGILGTLLACVICVAMAVGGPVTVLCIAVAGVFFIANVPLDKLLSLVGSNKKDQLQFYATNVDVFSTLTVFGNPPLANDQTQSYGALMVIYRYGVVGAVVFAMIFAAIGAASFRLLLDRARLGWRRYPLFIGCFASLVLLTKYPGIVPVVPSMCLAAALSIQLQRTNPFQRNGMRRSS